MYTYSFIIPHHNSPKLLNRCLDSIPSRNDIQIIVVDDNSDINKKPQLKRDDVTVIYIPKEETKWAGHARNVGLQHAHAKWILFADADDFYTPNFIEILDRYSDSDSDVIYFNVDSVNSDDLQPAKRTDLISKIMIDYALGESTLDDVKYRCRAPWNKMAKHCFLKTHNIFFEEICKGNDIQYSFAIGFFSKNVKVIQDVIYICTYSSQSMTYQKRSEISYIQSFENYYKIRFFFDSIGHKKWHLKHPFFIILPTLKNRNILFTLKILFSYIKKYRILKEKQFTYTDLFEQMV